MNMFNNIIIIATAVAIAGRMPGMAFCKTQTRAADSANSAVSAVSVPSSLALNYSQSYTVAYAGNSTVNGVYTAVLENETSIVTAGTVTATTTTTATTITTTTTTFINVKTGVRLFAYRGTWYFGWPGTGPVLYGGACPSVPSTAPPTNFVQYAWKDVTQPLPTPRITIATGGAPSPVQCINCAYTISRAGDSSVVGCYLPCGMRNGAPAYCCTNRNRTATSTAANKPLTLKSGHSNNNSSSNNNNSNSNSSSSSSSNSSSSSSSSSASLYREAVGGAWVLASGGTAAAAGASVVVNDDHDDGDVATNVVVDASTSGDGGGGGGGDERIIYRASCNNSMHPPADPGWRSLQQQQHHQHQHQLSPTTTPSFTIPTNPDYPLGFCPPPPPPSSPTPHPRCGPPACQALWGPQGCPDLHDVAPDLIRPSMDIDVEPAAGKRVRVVAPGFEGTQAYHALYLPKEWHAPTATMVPTAATAPPTTTDATTRVAATATAAATTAAAAAATATAASAAAMNVRTTFTTDGAQKLYPVIVEYMGNGPWDDGHGDVSTGRPEDSNLGWGMAEPAGTRYIWLSVPFLSSPLGASTQVSTQWWGCPTSWAARSCGNAYNITPTLDYLHAALEHVFSALGGDRSRVVITGWSRGAIATGAIGLADDRTARLWRAFIPYSHLDGDCGWVDQAAEQVDDDMQGAGTRAGAGARARASGGGGPPSKASSKALIERWERLAGRPMLYLGECGVATQGGPAWLAHLGLNGSEAVRGMEFHTTGFANHNDAWVLRNSSARSLMRSWLLRVLA